MIKFCNKCKYFKPGDDDYRESRCFNPKVNINDYYMLAHKKGESYGSSATDQRRHAAKPWNSVCGTEGRYWESHEQ